MPLVAYSYPFPVVHSIGALLGALKMVNRANVRIPYDAVVLASPFRFSIEQVA